MTSSAKRKPQRPINAFPMWLMICVFSLMSIACAGTETKKDKQIQDADFHFKMGAGYFESQEIALAIRELTKAIEMNPKHDKAHYTLGFIYMGRRDYSRAIRHFKKVLELTPKAHGARNNLGAVYLSMERWRDAIKIYEELLEEPLYTTPELAHNNLGWALYQLRRYNEARTHLKMATFLKPQFCLGYNNLGLVDRAMGSWDSSERNFRKAIKMCPTNYAEPHFNLGKLLQEKGVASARQHFARCIELQPNSNLGERCRQYIR